MDNLELYFQTLRAREKFTRIEQRMEAENLAYLISAGQFTLTAGHEVPSAVSVEGQAALQRIRRLVACPGPRILRERLNGTVRDVQWGTSQNGRLRQVQDLDDQLAALKLPQLAARGFEQALNTGMVAFWAHQGPRGPLLTRLSGYLEPLPSEEGDIDGVGGLLQTWQSDRNGWTVRIYDFEERKLREWLKCSSVTSAFGTRPSSETELDSVPHVGITYMDAFGLPIGEMVQGTPLIRAEMAAHFNVHRLREQFGFPVPVFKGTAEVPPGWGIGQPVRVPGDGDFSFAVPQIEAAFTAHDRARAELRDTFSLPYGILGEGTPSGEALAQANARFNAANRYYGRVIGEVLAAAVRDYTQLVGIQDAPEAQLIGNAIGEAEARWDMAIKINEAGLASLEACARAVQDALPGWGDDELEAWLQEQQGSSGPAAIRNAIKGLTPPQFRSPAEGG